jgi:hypothetical protein
VRSFTGLTCWLGQVGEGEGLRVVSEWALTGLGRPVSPERRCRAGIELQAGLKRSGPVWGCGCGVVWVKQPAWEREACGIACG